MKRIAIYFLLLSCLVGCHSKHSFSVSGSVADANQQWIYLEHTALTTTTVIDSCQITPTGDFALEGDAPLHPDFYRLRVGNRTLPLGVDSIESIVINTTYDSLPYTLSIEGSEASLIMAQMRHTARTASLEELRESAKQVIINNPSSLAAYYAVFLKQNGLYIWNILDPSDRRMYQAVATSFQTWMPEYERTKVLYNQVLEVLQAERSAKNQQVMKQFIADAENAVLDITLPDESGEMQTLSDLQGKVVILDFSNAEMEQSVGYNFELRELYNKYSKRGLEIYSVSIDRNKLLWEQTVEQLPWITVHADQNTAGQILLQYNVQGLPTLFLLDQKGNVQGRYIDFKVLESDIQKYL